MKNKTSKAHHRTPVEDGDTRPDVQENAADKKTAARTPVRKIKLTQQRSADVNSLDDFKDAK